MARPPRINLPSCLYHILCRGNLHDPVFLTDADFRVFLRYLNKYAILFSFRIHAYCLMKTHVHLLAESKEANISEFMRRLLTAYTVAFHRSHRTHGHLFSGRFKSLVVERGNYLIALSRYIHLNPVEAGLVKRAEDYPWSSMRGYVKQTQVPPFLFTDEILQWFQNNPAQYVQFIREGLSEETKPEIMRQRFIGSQAFARRISSRLAQMGTLDHLLPEERTKERSERKRAEGQKTAERYRDAVCRYYGCDPESFKSLRYREGPLGKALVMMVALLREETQWPFREIADFFGRTHRYIQGLYLRALKDREMEKEISRIKKDFMTETKKA